jgi:hypothetical protein
MTAYKRKKSPAGAVTPVGAVQILYAMRKRGELSI